MAPRKAPKKSEEEAKSSSPEGDFVSGTTPHAIDSMKSQSKIFETLDYEIKNFPNDYEKKSGNNRVQTSQSIHTPTTHDIQ